MPKKINHIIKSFLKTVSTLALGLFIGLLIIEIALRLIGWWHNKQHIEKQTQITAHTEKLIICVGDSYTEGIGATDGKDYPAQLERLVNSPTDTPYTVLNLGRSGKNTAQILLELPAYVQKYKTRYLILMAGSANYWNYWGYKKEKSFVDVFRTTQFLKLIYLNIICEKQKDLFNPQEYISRRNRTLELKTDSSSISILMIKNWETTKTNEVSKYIDSCYNADLFTEDDIINLMIYARLSDNEALFNTSIKNHKPQTERTKFYFFLSGIKNSHIPETISGFSAYQQSVYYFIEAIKNQKFDENTLKKCMSLNPYLEDTYLPYYSMGFKDIYLPSDYKQKRFSLFDSINYYKKLFGIDVETSTINYSFIDETPNKNIKTTHIDDWVKNDIQKAISLCKVNNIIPVLMNYPLMYNNSIFYTVNDVLKNLASENTCLFIDNEHLFDTITQNRNDYFIADGHCSNKGYGLIATEIFKLIKEQDKVLKMQGTEN